MAIKTSNQITFTEQKKVEKIEEWYLATSHDSDVTIEDGDWGIWTQEIQTINADHPYLWNYEKVIYSIGDPEVSDPIIIGFYGRGSDGKSIVNIKNYYQLTTDTNSPTSWQEEVPMLDSVNRYLWNYEEIIYNTGEPTETDPAIIGVYGDSGTDSINFQIYSVDGFEFNKDLTSIELKTIAFQGGEPIESDASYVWEYWNVSDEKYETISGATNSTLTVNIADDYALASIRCKMTYDGKVYEDYVSLTEKVTVYTSVIKFFNGSNVFKNTDKYLIAYMALYENGTEIDLLKTNQYAEATSIDATTNIISTTVSGSFENEQLLYFVLPDETYGNRYDIILGQYDGVNWKKVDTGYEHVYQNSLDANSETKIIIISKSEVNKTLSISFSAYKDDVLLSTADGNIIDLNDPFVSGIEPVNPVDGQLWIDTSRVPYVIKVCRINMDGSVEWVNSGQQFGGAVYTSKPTSYCENDIWILNNDELCEYYTDDGVVYSYGPGSMLRALKTSIGFNDSDWTEIKSELTDMRDNVAQYFEFNSETGLKIGQEDKKFYVQIDAQEMGFYDNSNANSPHKKVVSIGNQSATIRNATIEEGASFDCNAEFNKQIIMYNQYSATKIGFTWQIEANGSLSLVVIK